MSKIDFGPLEQALQDSDVTEIMVNSFNSIFLEKKGQIESAPFKFVDQRAYEEMIHAILFLSKKDATSSLLFDGVLPDGARFNITLPPLSPKSPTLTIRKHLISNSSLDMLVHRGSISPKAAGFLSACVRGRINVIVSGGTGTGKTTLLNALVSNIPANERVITIEDTPEIRLKQPNWIQLITNKDAKNPVNARECLVNALRMRPDRILVGECRGGEAADMLQAMNTGHEGSLTTIHANTANDCLDRLESLVIEGSKEISVKAVRRHITQAIDLIVQLRRGRHGARYISEITEVVGMEGEVITKGTVFHVPEGKSSGNDLISTGMVPSFLQRLEEKDIRFPPRFFDPKTPGTF